MHKTAQKAEPPQPTAFRAPPPQAQPPLAGVSGAEHSTLKEELQQLATRLSATEETAKQQQHQWEGAIASLRQQVEDERASTSRLLKEAAAEHQKQMSTLEKRQDAEVTQLKKGSTKVQKQRPMKHLQKETREQLFSKISRI